MIVLSGPVKVKEYGNLHSDDYFSTLSLQDGNTPLYFASLKGHCQVAELLLSKGANVNLQKRVYYICASARKVVGPLIISR